MAKSDKQSVCQKYFFGTTLLHAHAHYISIVGAKYQKPSVKALVQVDFLILSKHKHNPLFNRKQEKMAKFTKPSFCQKLIFWHQISSHKCSMCPYNAITQNICFVKGSHKYDVYLRDKNKAHLNQIKTVFWFSLNATWSNAPTTSIKECYGTSSGAILKQCHVNKQQDDFSSVLQ